MISSWFYGDTYGSSGKVSDMNHLESIRATVIQPLEVWEWSPGA
jgi:hypothetical protein